MRCVIVHSDVIPTVEKTRNVETCVCVFVACQRLVYGINDCESTVHVLLAAITLVAKCKKLFEM